MKRTDKWVFFSALPPFRGGIAKFSARTLQALSQSKDVKSFTFRKQYPDILFPGTSQLEPDVNDELAERIVSTFNPITYLTSLLRIRQERPTVFVTSYWMTFMSPLMVFWALFLPKRTKKVAIIHNLIPHEKRFFDALFNRIFLSAYDIFIVLSSAVQQDVLSYKPSANVVLLSHPPYEAEGTLLSKAQARTQLGLDPHKKTLLFFGLIRTYKGLAELINAFGRLDDSYQLLIAGEVYGDAQFYMEALNELPNPNWKFVNRYLPDTEVDMYFAAADLVVLPYLSATQSGIRSLALSQKRAVLCTNVGGLAEGLVASGQGFDLLSTDPNSFADRIQSLFNQGDIEKCNAYLATLNIDHNDAWLSFALGLIHFTEEA
ncbi:MAG: glycosyltransferase [Cryomorphaceae bacterium]|nr:glycosyltransferase [Cryomorphaceae bacterium]